LSAPQLFSFILRLGKEELFILPLFACAAGAACSHFWEKGNVYRYLIFIIFTIFIGLSLLKWAANIKSFMIFIE
jgi:fucose permease